MSKRQLLFKLIQRGNRDLHEVHELDTLYPRASLGDVRFDGSCSTNGLPAQSWNLARRFFWERIDDGKRQTPSEMPHSQSSEILHARRYDGTSWLAAHFDAPVSIPPLHALDDLNAPVDKRFDAVAS